jgi:hypothetical protein
MTDSGQAPAIDVSTIVDPDIRRAFRGILQINQQLSTRINQQQQEIEALLQMMIEKHVGSLGEFKRHMMKLQAGEARSERIHGQVAGATVATPTATANPAVRTPKPATPTREEYAEPEVDRPRRYTL